MNTISELKFDRRRSRVKTCPCGKSNRDGKFVPFMGHDDKGYCHSCGKTFLPDQESIEVYTPIQEPPASYIPASLLKASLKGYDNNVFAQFLVSEFGGDVASVVIGKYFIGSTKDGGTIFWQIDIEGNIRSGKVIHYEPDGHRRKDIHPTWAHAELRLRDYNLKQCLFGEHLLKRKGQVAIVESEKTACIASVYLPGYIWLACGGKDGLKTEKMMILRGRKVTLFPDLDGLDLWSKRADELSPMLDIRVSDLLERKASPEEREDKLDIADYLLRFSIEREKPKSPLQRMIEKNPAVQLLIDSLDLIQN